MKYVRFGAVGIIFFGTLQTLFAQARLSQAGPMVVELTNEVRVAETVRFGINRGGIITTPGAVLAKNRAPENFKGKT